MYTPENPSFTLKVGCKGVYITRTCLHDMAVNIYNGGARFLTFSIFNAVLFKCSLIVRIFLVRGRLVVFFSFEVETWTSCNLVQIIALWKTGTFCILFFTLLHYANMPM